MTHAKHVASELAIGAIAEGTKTHVKIAIIQSRYQISEIQKRNHREAQRRD